jgi:N6-L-threonylcarbamoyladenine synthase/protein kinase Bud32
MRVLGIEGTAWAASAAVYDTEADEVLIETDAYQPDSGGIHPREAAEHMRDAIPEVVAWALAEARERADGGPPVDCVAFSRGPGLGPCLRIVASAARALAGRLDVELVGVNHMVAHLEIGRHRSGFDSPVCLNASGANAHLLGFRNGRYRVLGETTDTGVGNAIDKFTRHLGWSHPGGPKVERRARDGAYHELPYVVTGMDFSFSGIMSAAKAAVDDGRAVEDVCRGLEETVFAMLTEVSERALALTGGDELVLGGGVGQNDRLRGMLETMCEARGADFFAPEPRFLRDNAGMIAVLGAKMYRAGDTIPTADSRIDPDFRPDEVPVTWRTDESVVRRGAGSVLQGAEAEVTVEGDPPDTVRKRRLPKAYRHPDLDARLRRERTRAEARLLRDARRAGVPTPLVRDVDLAETTLTIEFVGDDDLRDLLADPDAARATRAVRNVGRHLATLHDAGLVHGDPTTRNVRAGDDRTHLIDFGLGYHAEDVEAHAMDLHVFCGSLDGTADDAERLRAAVCEAYAERGDERVVEHLAEVEGRGRYQ